MVTSLKLGQSYEYSRANEVRKQATTKHNKEWNAGHYDDVIMGTIASQITSLTSVYSTVYSGADQSKHQSSASLAFVWGIHRGPVNSPHKWPVTRKMFPFDGVIIHNSYINYWHALLVQVLKSYMDILSTNEKVSLLIKVNCESDTFKNKRQNVKI